MEGGNDRIARELAAGLGGAVRLLRGGVEGGMEPARGQGGRRRGGVGRRRGGDRGPASVLDAISFDPPLAPEKAAVRYGQAAKLFVALRTPAPPSEVLSVAERFWCYTQLGADGEPLPFVGAFAGSPRALETLEVAAGPERWLAALARLRPDLDLDLDAVMLSTWAEDPWVRGAYSARSATVPLDAEALARSGRAAVLCRRAHRRARGTG